MRRGIGLLFIAVVLHMACSTGSRKPNAPLDRAKFERVLAGSLLIEARLSQEIPVEGVSEDATAAFYNELFEREGTTEEDFKATYETYLQYPELLKEVYQAALNQLQQQADSLGQ